MARGSGYMTGSELEGSGLVALGVSVGLRLGLTLLRLRLSEGKPQAI
jgi:hypothetical protein